MKIVLVYCIKELEWQDYCRHMLRAADESITLYMEIREESIIIHNWNTVCLKVTPDNFDAIPLMYRISKADKIYLCDKDEWESLAMLNKMRRGAS